MAQSKGIFFWLMYLIDGRKRFAAVGHACKPWACFLWGENIFLNIFSFLGYLSRDAGL